MSFQRLLLITQLHRSGGTLFSQLLDGHSGIKAHPHELFIGKPNKWDWPALDHCLDSPGDVFSSLYEQKIADLGRKGNFIKPGSNKAASDQVVPFSYDYFRHKEIFCEHYSHCAWKTRRLAIQLYLETFFMAWPEFRFSGREVYTSCFLPHVLVHENSMHSLLSDFPDLFLVSLIRRPDAWLASLVNHIGLDLSDPNVVDHHLNRWQDSIKLMISYHVNPAVHSYSTSYERLVNAPEQEMKRFCQVAGIAYEPVLLIPTVGGFPVRPNSSYNVSSHGINHHSIDTGSRLPPVLKHRILSDYMPLYHAACCELGVEADHVKPSNSFVPQQLTANFGTQSTIREESGSISSAELQNFCKNKLATATVSKTPYPYLLVPKFLPRNTIKAIQSHYPSEHEMSPMPASRTGNVYAHKHRRILTLTDASIQAMSEPNSQFWQNFRQLIISLGPSLLDSLPLPVDNQRSLYVDPEHLQVRIDLWSDQGGYQISPHTDAPHKLATFLLYCSDDQALSAEGTSVFTPRDASLRCWTGKQWPFEKFVEVYRAPYAANSLFGFRKTDFSFHGKLPVQSSSRTRRTVSITLQNVDHFVA
jgi:hypothetical protein